MPVGALSVETSSTTTAIDDGGQVVPYTFTVTNNGTQTLHGVTVTDEISAPGTGGQLSAITCRRHRRWPRPRRPTCTADYTVSQADLDSTTGVVADTATAHAREAERHERSTRSHRPTPSDTVPNGGLTIVKTADPTTVTAAGDTIEYSFLVTNTGNVTVSGLNVVDQFTARSR